MELYPDAENADHALFFVGEIHFAEGWFEPAVAEYQKLIVDYPESDRVSAALLKQARALFELDEKDSGMMVLEELLRKRPGSREAGEAKKWIGEMAR